MLALNLNDICDKNINYGILLCGNDSVTVGIIQDKIIEIKDQLKDKEDDWIIDDVIAKFPKEWNIKLQHDKEMVWI